MAGGDTINGKVKMVREETDKSQIRVFGPLNTSLWDNRGSVSDQLYLNPGKAANRPPPVGGNRYAAPKAHFVGQELVLLQHLSASLAEAIDYDADEYEISIIEWDTTRKRPDPDVLTVQDQELSSNPTSSTSDYVTFYQETVPDLKEYFVAGSVNAAAVENA